jgi:SAM-dependent methyltransferase
MSTHDQAMRETWEASFAEQVAAGAYNTAPVEALVRTVSYYLRDRGGEQAGLHMAELGCGAGPNLIWLAEKGMSVSGVDISPTALGLAQSNLERHGFADRVGSLIEASVADVPWEDESLDGLLESCVFQHLPREDRERAFAEVRRLLKPGGVFVGHMLEQGHTVFQKNERVQLADDPGTMQLDEGGSKFHLTNIGLSHFFTQDEIHRLFDGFSLVEPCLSQYEIPPSEAKKRGYDSYLQSMLIVYAVK